MYIYLNISFLISDSYKPMIWMNGSETSYMTSGGNVTSYG